MEGANVTALGSTWVEAGMVGLRLLGLKVLVSGVGLRVSGVVRALSMRLLQRFSLGLLRRCLVPRCFNLLDLVEMLTKLRKRQCQPQAH